ncbi:MAG: fumarate hydratase [Nitrospirota bacterium]|nr:fumarate hydratase [Nitrospirota bacterium]MDH4360170.1 fumarate hydratase [Nitrospirota bacterium]MDH5296367.1 fumarate hydratase [Nitrospirota bacterium]MDH5575416.1 fumarate hydratase [Nitrospirota bacterium]
MAAFQYQEIFEHAADTTTYRKLTSEYVSTSTFEGQEIVKVQPEALTLLAREAMDDVAHLLRPGHLAQLAKILDDPEASDNDRFVAMELLKNANIAAGRVLPGCQDTGTAIAMGYKGQQVFTTGRDAEAISRGIFDAYDIRNLRYSQMAPLDMYTEENTGTNLPAQIDLYTKPGSEYQFLFIAKGGGSANKTFLFQETKALLNPKSLLAFVAEKIRSLGTSACPPYHLALVVGGLSAEFTLKTVKLASCHYLDNLPTSGNPQGRAFRDLDMEEQIFQLCAETGIGAQFGGKYFAHDVRVIRLPRHGASCPVGLGVSCSADRQILGKITREGIFLEQLETNPAKYLPDVTEQDLGGRVVKIDLNRPMGEILAELRKHPVATRLSLTGPIVVARDIAHARLKEQLDAGKGLPQYLKDHVVYYAGPAKKPQGHASGSFGPTTAGRMDSYVDQFQAVGGSMVMLAKGNRSKQVREACGKHGGFYLGSIGGPAARLAEHSIKKVEVLEFEDLGMEAVWKIEVEDFPAFTVINHEGKDFYADLDTQRPPTLVQPR